MKKETQTSATPDADAERRVALKRIGRFAAVTPPTVALLLAGASKPSKAAPLSPTDDVSPVP